MSLLQRFLGARTQSHSVVVPEPHHNVAHPKRVMAVVVCWVCHCTVIWARSTETVEAVCSICGGQFERDGSATAANMMN
jgi:hypothetical protein